MEIDGSREEIELKNIANEILMMHPTKKILIYNIHSLLGQFVSNLDKIIKNYKIMTITLLLATGTAIGFSFSSELKDLQVNKLMMSSIACLFGVIGITAIWYLDVRVFHKFWGSFFVEEVKMEKKYPFLTNIEDISVSLDNIKARIFGDGNFYIFLNIILITASGSILSFLTNSLLIKIVIFSAILVIDSLVFALMNISCKNLQKALERLLSAPHES